MMTIKEFCERHNACDDGMQWAVNNCFGMKQVWNAAKPEWLIWIATRDGVLTDKELKLFAIWSARQVQHLMTDQRSITALDVAERYVNGAATESELAAARAEAWDAVSVASKAAARSAASAIFTARAAARSVARAEAWEAVSVAVRAAVVRDAARAAAWASTNDAATEAATDAARAVRSARSAAADAQARYLRFNCKPIFESTVITNNAGNPAER
jgi:hypothetical protein